MAMRLTDEQLDWICDRVPDVPRNPLGGRPPTDKRKAIAGIFWILDNGAKWKDLPREFGSKSAVHRCFKRWVEGGVFERIMRDAGRLVETAASTGCTSASSTARSARPGVAATGSASPRPGRA
jgi:hypothetical protein